MTKNVGFSLMVNFSMCLAFFLRLYFALMNKIIKILNFFSSSSDEEDADADYEDSEYESDSSDSELDEGCSNIKLSVPLHPMQQRRKPSKTCPHKGHQKNQPVSSTEQDSEDDSEDSDSSSAGDSETESELEENVASIDDFSGSETNTECDFTDSEGRPNPFHKELEVPSILIEPGSPEVPGMRRYPEDIIEANSSKTTSGVSSDNLNFSANRFQYKTPNLADDLAKKEKSAVANSQYIGRSTQRAFNLKKHWVSDANAHGAGAQNKSNDTEKKTELDNRFKSLMDRLSNQQKLLKPADKPSTQMEHFMKRTSHGTVKSISTDPLITSPLKSPAVIFSRQTSDTVNSDGQGQAGSQKFTYPPPYRPAMSSTTTNGIVPTANSIQNSKFNSINQDQPVSKSKSEKALFCIDSENPEEIKIDEKAEPAPPPIPPIPDIYVEEHKALLSEKKSKEEEIVQKESEPVLVISQQTNDDVESNEGTNNTTFESCNENNDTNEENYMTPANELSLNPEDLKDQDDIPLADDDDVSAADTLMDLQPLATSSPATIDLSGSTEYIKSPTESEKAFIQKCKEIKLTDDEIMRIYQERNPLERLAKFNSLKRKQSSVVHEMILSASANR